jgi:glc operon protein GlcG
MRPWSLIATVTFASVLLGSAVCAQQPPPTLPDYGPPITLDQAIKVADAAHAEAKKMNLIEAIAIVDPAGHLVYFLKMDNARNAAPALAQHKARTAAMYKLPSKAYEDRVAAGGIGITVLTLDDVIASSGGIPIMSGGKIIGAIGVGGGPNGTLDAPSGASRRRYDKIIGSSESRDQKRT